MTRTMTFTATAQARPRGGIAIALPFDPAEAWGDRDRYYLAGTIEQLPDARDGDARWRRADADAWARHGAAIPESAAGASLQVSLHPEGPQLDTISPDFADALRAEPEARRLFESLATFYRNAFVTWVEGAKRPETRARRIAETVDDLKAGRRGAIGPLTRPAVVAGSIEEVRAGS